MTPNIDRTVLNNGIVLLVTENPTADIVAAKIFLRSGSSYEKREQAGLTHLLSSVLTKGCYGLSSMEIAEQVESVGASLGVDASSDYFLLSVKTVTSDFAEILELAAKILRSPTFPETQIELERRITLQDIRSQKEHPFTVAFDQLRHTMYQDHPYAMSALGYENTVSKLTRDDLVNFHHTHFRPDNVVISIAGRITSEEAETLVNSIFGDWQNNSPELEVLNFNQITVEPRQVLTAQQTQQSIVMLGYFAPGVFSADYAALKLLATYLGNGLSSRLFVELREKRGLAYEVSAFYPTKLFPASFVVYMGTAPENTKIALEGLHTEVDLLWQSTLEVDALQAAKNKILGQYSLGKQTNGQIAQLYGWYETLGLGINFDQEFQKQISDVTVKDAIAAATQYLQQPYISLVGREEAICSAVNVRGKS
ncbi:M16 family metallopeptidase [Calothrix sp. 336/3]|uniref:M16 family metallopeptidase n=1 Tax=Calothrix sp. 336/3 TaxID=1337936 RepID=UPI0004E45F93|nr:pitrilysin family protein [Calothrix sp. 336/3]AKG22075.1 peptidase M16 [Calothrix sp. 336/3]